MNERIRTGARLLLQLGLAASTALAQAEPVIRFDTMDSKQHAPVSLFNTVREATKDAELPAVGVVKESAEPAAKPLTVITVGKPVANQELTFVGRDGNWCPDGQVYRGGPCDFNDPYYRGGYDRNPYRSPYDDPNWYRRNPRYPGSGNRYPGYGGRNRRYPGRGPTRDPWRDPPTRRRGGW